MADLGRGSGSWLQDKLRPLAPRVRATPARGPSQIAKRYHEQGPEGLHHRQHTTSWGAPRLLSAEQQEELRQALAGEAPDRSKRWRARAVADWMADQLADQLGRPVCTQRGWDYLQRLQGLKHSQQVPRPRQALADFEQQADFKKSSARS